MEARGVRSALHCVVHGLEERILARAVIAGAVVVVVAAGAPRAVGARAALTVKVVHVDAEGHHAAEALAKGEARLRRNEC